MTSLNVSGPGLKQNQASALDWIAPTEFPPHSARSFPLCLCLASPPSVCSPHLPTRGSSERKQDPCSLTGSAIGSTLLQAAHRTPGELGEPLKAHPSRFLLIQHAPVWVWEISLPVAAKRKTLLGENPFCSYYWGMASHLLSPPAPPRPILLMQHQRGLVQQEAY